MKFGLGICQPPAWIYFISKFYDSTQRSIEFRDCQFLISRLYGNNAAQIKSIQDYMVYTCPRSEEYRDTVCSFTEEYNIVV